MAEADIPAQEPSFKDAVPAHIPSFEKQPSGKTSVIDKDWITRYVNVYFDGSKSWFEVYDTRALADKFSSSRRVACIAFKTTYKEWTAWQEEISLPS